MLMPNHALARTRLRWFLGQVAIVAAAVFCYFQVRGLTAAAPATAFAHAHEVQDIEADLHLDIEGAVQAPFTASPVGETAVNWIYIWGHWPVIIVTMVWLAWRHRRYFLRLRDAMLVSGALGLVVFVTFPVAPPRLADGSLVDTVTEKSQAYRVLQPPNFVNQYAAMPSLHAGWDLLVGISIATAAGWVAVRAIGWILPVLMALAVVATGNHYVIDVVAGLGLALVGFAVALVLEQRRDSRASVP